MGALETPTLTMDDNGFDVGQQKLHPFFRGSQNPAQEESISKPKPIEQSATSPHAEGIKESTDDQGCGQRKRCKRDNVQEPSDMQSTPLMRPKRGRKKASLGTGIKGHFTSHDNNSPEPREHARIQGPKKQPVLTSSVIQLAERRGQLGALSETPDGFLDAGHGVSKDDTNQMSQTPMQSTRPQKLLKLNTATGTIGSPPRLKARKADATCDKQRSLSHGKKALNMLVCIDYGRYDVTARVRLGNKIGAILDGAISQKLAKSLKPSQAPDLGVEKDQPRPKLKTSPTAHPFFLPKPSRDSIASEPNKAGHLVPPPSTKAKKLSATPCSPRKSRQAAPTPKYPQFGIKNSGLRVPGSKLPAWPWKGIAHVRGGPDIALSRRSLSHTRLLSRKSKGNAVQVPSNEDVLLLAQFRMDLRKVRDELAEQNLDDFQKPPPELSLPEKHLETGGQLQKRLLKEISRGRNRSGRVLTSSDDKSPSSPSSLLQSHPAITKTFNSIHTSLSAYDRSQCEPCMWTVKYAPSAAAEVLQSGREAMLLRDWLQRLKVQSVDTGAPEADHIKAGVAPAGRSKSTTVAKKKRKRKNLADFIVSSGEEDNELGELSDADENWSPNSSLGTSKKTVIRTGDIGAKGSKEAGRLTNAVVISGPHGCGKTAAVYAIAKELGFEVFEISPNSRRSGKDVLEKIGDMTRNHLVQQHKATAGDTESDSLDDAQVAKDIQSGKQATMNAFFLSKGSKKPKMQPKTTAAAQAAETKRAASKGQKQSLILLEEVDILYDEDKQFWATVMSLIAQSKRPFVMTCNDETLVPLQSLNLHGIFRFTAAPTDAAADLLLSIAANEGHLLDRARIEALYDSRGRDLRASLTDLSYWCQIGVGDRRGGFDWFYLRWPEGVDVDENGDVIRVVSSGTYCPEKTWFGCDGLVDAAGEATRYLDAEENLLMQIWDFWSLEASCWQDWQGFGGCCMSNGAPRSGNEQWAALRSYEQFTDAMSCSDLCSAHAFALSKEVHLDTTLPELPVESRDDFVLGMQLLEATPTSSYDLSGLRISLRLRSLAREIHSDNLSALGYRTGQLERATVTNTAQQLRRQFQSPLTPERAITRFDHSLAFDPIAVSDKPTAAQEASRSLDPSVFDRTMELITVDVAPYVRGIVAYDEKLLQDRLRLSNLISEGGRKAKKMRTTRSAYSALEGGSRNATRREKYFSADINPRLVLRTGGDSWLAAVEQAMTGDGDDTGSLDSKGSREDADEVWV